MGLGAFFKYCNTFYVWIYMMWLGYVVHIQRLGHVLTFCLFLWNRCMLNNQHYQTVLVMPVMN